MEEKKKENENIYQEEVYHSYADCGGKRDASQTAGFPSWHRHCFARKVSVSGRGGESRGAPGFPSPVRFTFGGTVTLKSSKLWPAPS